jgi:23S rRNA (cytidine2498-2'-O)-methyltransferase
LTPRIVAHCRAGFEPEAAADLRAVAAIAETELAVDAPPGRGYVVVIPRVFDSQRWPRAFESAQPMFVRALFFGTGPHELFDAAKARGRPDRVAPLIALAEAFRSEFALPGASRASRGHLEFGELRLEIADTNDGKEISGLCRAIERPLHDALRELGILSAANGDARAAPLPALHVLLPDGAHVYVGGSRAPWGSRWPMGIPRLRMPHSAPSRSTLKLAEALQTFLGDRDLDVLQAGMRAVDLGAAPGGWTWQLVQRGLRVTAVDNAALKGDIASDPLVTHIRADGLRFLPRKRVDWMVCDIVEQPSRIAALVARWIGEGHARHAIFNLKLPMKKRYVEVQRCEAIIRDALDRAHIRAMLRFKQLYHDREEITGYCARSG